MRYPIRQSRPSPYEPPDPGDMDPKWEDAGSEIETLLRELAELEGGAKGIQQYFREEAFQDVADYLETFLEGGYRVGYGSGCYLVYEKRDPDDYLEYPKEDVPATVREWERIEREGGWE